MGKMSSSTGGRSKSTTQTSMANNENPKPYGKTINSKKFDIRKARREAQKVSCGASSEKETESESADTSTIPRSTIMAMPTITKLDKIRKGIRKPLDSVPPVGFETWIDMPLDRKIPYLQIPDNVISRGKIGKGLKIRSPNFTLYQDRINKGPYTAMHDPCSKNYFSQPHVQKLLIKQGLMNEKQEVLCSLNDFNKWRAYCSEVNNGQLNEMLKGDAERDKYEKEQLQLIMRSEDVAKPSKHRFRSNINKLENQTKTRQSFQDRQRQASVQLERQKEMQEIQKLHRIAIAIERDTKTKLILAASKQMTMDFRRRCLVKSFEKQMDHHRRVEANAMIRKEDAINFKNEWLDAKLEYGKQHSAQTKKILESTHKEQKKKAEKRQENMKQAQTRIAVHNEKRKAKNTRLWEIVRKYAMIWLNKVREKMNDSKSPKDPSHDSFWDNRSGKPSVLQDFVNNVRGGIKPTKMEDMVLQILLSRSKFGGPLPSNSSTSSEDTEEKELNDQVNAEIDADKESEKEALEKERRKNETKAKQEAELAERVAGSLVPAPARLSLEAAELVARTSVPPAVDG